MGIFAGSGVGKSTLLGMMARNSSADVNVIALIGERGREVLEFIDKDLGPKGLARSVVVVSTSDQPALLRVKAALVATAIAEYFRDQGKNVLLMMDSITRFAMAQREIGLAVGEPPTSRGYTPSVFALLPKLLERAGKVRDGSITGLYTILVEGDDMNEPIADAARGILDGHIVLSRKIATQNHFPAIDVLESSSRLMPSLADVTHRSLASQLRHDLALYNNNLDLINIGAYEKGSNPQIDTAMQNHPHIIEFLKQDVNETLTMEQTLDQLAAIFTVGGAP
jgi:FliI/YscN family ATPase